MSRQALVFANFLAPTLYKTYQSIVEYVEHTIDIPTYLLNGESLNDFAEGFIDAGFICGLAYVHLARQSPSPVELIAAPILTGTRYQQRPWYFSDIVVHAGSDIRTFEELRGRTWAYNEKPSHSGYNIVQYMLLERGERLETFAKTIETGSHAQSLHMVVEGMVDAAAVDSHMLDMVLRNRPDVAQSVRIVDSFGPSTIPPVVVSSHVPAVVKSKLRERFLTMHEDRVLGRQLELGLIERFVPISDAQYQDIRAMDHKVQQSIAG
jgi:phosphate/phosphite/phosphonate ABC transporter binding protein